VPHITPSWYLCIFSDTFCFIIRSVVTCIFSLTLFVPDMDAGHIFYGISLIYGSREIKLRYELTKLDGRVFEHTDVEANIYWQQSFYGNQEAALKQQHQHLRQDRL
jgi:hypothetical protein